MASCKLNLKQAAILLLIGAIGFLAIEPGIAQEQPWSPPRKVFETEGWTFHLASVVEDADHLIAIWQYNPYRKLGADIQLSNNDNDSLFVSRFDGANWASPVEVLLGRIASERLAVATTPDGLLHVFSQGRCLWYSRVPLHESGRARSWLPPICLAEGASSWPAVAVSDDDRINLIFLSGDATSLNLISSDDSGANWSSPQLITQSFGRGEGLSAPAVTEATDGTLHLVWSVVPLPNGYPALTINYARSTDRGSTWSEPQQLAGPRQSQSTIVADRYGRIHVAWNGDAGDHGRYYIRSDDQGMTWGPVETVLRGKGGFQMPPALATDETGVVHGLFTDEEHLVYAQRTSSSWSLQQELLGPNVAQDPAKLGEVDSVGLHILNGNQLHALYTRYDYGEVLHQSREINAPHKTSTAGIPTAVTLAEPVLPTATQTAISQAPSSTPTPDIIAFGSRQVETKLPWPGLPLLISTLLAAFCVGTVVLAKIVRRR